MADRVGVIWTRATEDGQPRKVGTLVATPDQVRLTYDGGAPVGVSILHDVQALARAREPIVMERTAFHPLPPYLAPLVPPPGDNPARVFLSTLLAQRGVRPLPGQEDWDLLMAFGRNGIGHLDVFAGDGEAERYYAEPIAPHIVGANADRRGLWRAWKELSRLSSTPEKTAMIEDVVGPTPAVTGMVPKLAATLDPAWVEIDGPPIRAIVKIEPEIYPGVLEMEKLAYDAHERAGCDVPRAWHRLSVHGTPLLITERFDRHPDGRPIPTESLFAILRLASNGRIEHRWSIPDVEARFGDRVVPTLDHVRQVLATPEIGIGRDERKEMFRRVAMALMTGNSDLHLENMSVVGPRGEARLSKVYDPAPMRAYPIHGMTLALDLPRTALSRPGSRLDLWPSFIGFANDLGIPRPAAIEILLECRDTTGRYVDQIKELAGRGGRSGEAADNLVGILEGERRHLNLEIAPPPAQPLRMDPAMAQAERRKLVAGMDDANLRGVHAATKVALQRTDDKRAALEHRTAIKVLETELRRRELLPPLAPKPARGKGRGSNGRE